MARAILAIPYTLLVANACYVHVFNICQQSLQHIHLYSPQPDEFLRKALFSSGVASVWAARGGP